MSEQKHTTNLVLEIGETHNRLSSNGDTVAMVLRNTGDIFPEEQDANCQLWVAASDLLAALKALLPVAEQFERQSSKGAGGRRGGPAFEKARAAIAKAQP